MKEPISLFLALLAAAAGLSTPANSHHSHSMFDHSQLITVTGTVTEYVFRNPHVSLFIDVEEDDGEIVNYWIEMSNIPNMIKRGIGSKTFKAGDEISVNMHQLKDSRPGGNYDTVVAADGTAYE
jgi:hypothetical protein